MSDAPHPAPAYAHVVIIGAGAAGLATAIFAAQTAQALGIEKPRIVVLDGARKVGAKILVAGGGRCNVTHKAVSQKDFQGTPHFVRNVLRAFDVRATGKWFASMGVFLKEEDTGKLFPATDDAKTVLAALLHRIQELGAGLYQQHRVIGLTQHPSTHEFTITHSLGTTRAKYVVMATGGRSLPKSGSDGAGWEMVKALGHTVTPTYPALVALTLKNDFFHAELSGIALPVELSTWVCKTQGNNQAEGPKIKRDARTGEMLFTHTGISGPVAMDASRFWIIARAYGEAPEIHCNFFPGEDFTSVENWLMQQTRENAQRSIGRCLADRLPRNVATQLLAYCKIDQALTLGQLTRDGRRHLVHTLTGLVLPVTGDRGWNHAEVTAGGVPLEEINFRTMASHSVPGLFLTGEMLDCEGRIGGFNFQWAWATGYLAGTAVAQSLKA